MSRCASFLACFSTLILIIPVLCLKNNYYWRNYNGFVPVDAVVAGKDYDGNYVYIGQAYVKRKGHIPVQIRPGEREVFPTVGGTLGITKVDNCTKILCGEQENFYWMTAKSDDLHLKLLGKHAVRGGHEDNKGEVNIGKIDRFGETKIGKIVSYDIGKAKFHCNETGNEEILDSFEVLMYNNNNNGGGNDTDPDSPTVSRIV